MEQLKNALGKSRPTTEMLACQDWEVGYFFHWDIEVADPGYYPGPHCRRSGATGFPPGQGVRKDSLSRTADCLAGPGKAYPGVHRPAADVTIDTV